MAALRFAARRLVGGGGQTPAVAVGESQRRLFPRLFQVDRARSTTSSAATANSNAAAGCSKLGDDRERRVKLLTEISKRREELYDLTSEAESIYKLPRREAREFGRLGQELATQVERRPDDRMWRVLRAKSALKRYGGYATFMFSAWAITGMSIGAIVYLEPHERRGR